MRENIAGVIMLLVLTGLMLTWARLVTQSLIPRRPDADVVRLTEERNGKWREDLVSLPARGPWVDPDDGQAHD